MALYHQAALKIQRVSKKPTSRADGWSTSTGDLGLVRRSKPVAECQIGQHHMGLVNSIRLGLAEQPALAVVG